MQRVAVLGSGGAGKSTLAGQISERTGLPVVHLDPLFWRAGWTPGPTEEVRAAFAAAIAGDRWILDGNFLGEGGDDGARFARADTAVFLDRSRWLCLWRIAGRVARSRGRRRPDLPDGCDESVDVSFLRWVWGYPRKDRLRVLALLAQLDGVDVHHLRSGRDVERFLASL
jgi:adenylate kinase family enzyme